MSIQHQSEMIGAFLYEGVSNDKNYFTSHYMRDAPSSQLENNVRYINTREGIEKIDESRCQLPATEKISSADTPGCSNRQKDIGV